MHGPERRPERRAGRRAGPGASGWANAFYSAAVQAGAASWKAFFFGSSDAANAITVDKPPAALWPMALAARVFGVNPWSVLVPQALMGVATVGVVHAAVRRRFPAWAALLAGAVLALTPVAAPMFRFDNPDALLVLLLPLGAYGTLRAQETASTRRLLFAAACAGTGFLAKMLQAFLVVPVFALVYLLAAPCWVRRRVWQVAAAGGVLIASAGWWVAAVALAPASSRALHRRVAARLRPGARARLQRARTPQRRRDRRPRQPRPGRRMGRMVGPVIGGQVSWLLPAALILLAAGPWTTRRAPRPRPVGRMAAAHRRRVQLHACTT